MNFVNPSQMTSELVYYPNPNFPNRYISPEKLFNYLQHDLKDYITQIGSSFLGKPIYKATFGNGDIKILAWSQMHGNESNATHAMLDLVESFTHQEDLQQNLFSKISMDFIFMLNPDGSQQWTRRNALDIDLNRDYIKEASKEFPLLKNIALEGNYDYALNLHEQRTLFSTDGKHPATLSFLAPAENESREITETRKKSMAIIAKINEVLQNEIPNQIARYNDEFYPTSTGDNFMKLGIPTILFEGGHFPDDYLRKNTRKYYTYALYQALIAIDELRGKTDYWEKYLEIPENREDHFDIIYRNVSLNTNYPCTLDIAVQYKEIIENCDEEITFVPIIVEIGDCSQKKGWKEIDCTGKIFVSEKFPKLDSVVDFDFR